MDCWAKGGGKAGEGPKRKGQDGGDRKDKDKNKGKEAVASTKELEAAWIAMTAFSDGENNHT